MLRLLPALVIAAAFAMAQSAEDVSHWIQQGRYSEAHAWLTARLAAADRPGAPPEHPIFRARLYQMLGLACNSLSRYAETQRAAEQGLALLETLGSTDPPDLAVALWIGLAEAHVGQAHFLQAEAALRKVQALAAQSIPPDDRRQAPIHEAWGGFYHAQHQLPRAETSLRAAVTILERALGPDHPDTATRLLSLVAVLRERRKFTEALDAAGRAQSALERSLGSAHPTTLTAKLHFGLAQLAVDPAQAEPGLRRLLDEWLASQPHRHITVASLWNALAAARYAQRDPAGAADYCHRSLDLLRDLFGPEHPQVVTVMFNQAALLQAAKQKKAAAALRAEAERIRKARGYTSPSENSVDFRALLPR